MITHWEMLLRITVAAFLGGVIGAERDIHRRQAGLRTHLIVSMASATFMVVSGHFVYFQNYVPGQLVTVDTSRIAASVVAGVGFLGGGSILRTGATVQGLTTAAALWLVAAIGLCAGSGMYIESVFVTVVGLLALTVLRVLEDKKVVRRRVVLTLDTVPGGRATGPFDAVSAELGVLKAKVLDLDYHEDRAAKRTTLSFDILLPDSLDFGKLVSILDTVQGVREVQVRVP
ncbi:MAG TPA: MgtC/SapB family protein [Anaeromyxobacteraceae bacterium]|nr:MgtC/SapB family protein [Anaeromyxobacteraceae bacterium]